MRLAEYGNVFKVFKIIKGYKSMTDVPITLVRFTTDEKSPFE